MKRTSMPQRKTPLARVKSLETRAEMRRIHDEVTFGDPQWAYDLGILRHSWGGDAA